MLHVARTIHSIGMRETCLLICLNPKYRMKILLSGTAGCRRKISPATTRYYQLGHTIGESRGMSSLLELSWLLALLKVKDNQCQNTGTGPFLSSSCAN